MSTHTAALNSDQVLALHRVSQRKFELSGLRTGSVKDQMLRAHLVVERLHRQGMIDGKRLRLVIVGGGAAGVVAALTAANKGVDVCVFEQHRGVMRTQMLSTRRIDPSEYDWPQKHWDAGLAPWLPSAIPLIYEGGRANVLAADWEEDFDAWLKMGKLGKLPPGKGVIKLRRITNAKDFEFSDVSNAILGTGILVYPKGRPYESDFFGAALSCAGFSGEKVSVAVGAFKGYEFWGNDPLEGLNFGLPTPPGETFNVLLSGGGDGAQQDFQRALTGKFGRELYEEFRPHLPKHELLQAVLAEDAARRAFAWRRSDHLLTESLESWHQAYFDVAVTRIWNSIGWFARRRLARKILRPHVRATWIAGGATPDFCYGLNRFLTLLLAHLHAWKTKRKAVSVRRPGQPFPAPSDEVIVFGYWVQRVTSAPGTRNKDGVTLHRCGSPDSCLGVPHRVELTNVMTPPPGHPTVSMKWFHAVVIRHGVEQSPFFGIQAPVREQVVPFGLPA